MSEKQARKKLGLLTLISLVAGNMIGSGVFMLPAALAVFGTIGILAWLATSIGAMFLALTFAEFSRIHPKTGGPYAYTRAGFGEFIGFLVAYNYWNGLWVGNAAISVAFVGYVAVFFPILQHNMYYAFLVSSAVVWLLSIVNILGLSKAGVVQIVTTVLKLIPLLLVASLGLMHVKLQNLMNFNVSGHSNFSAFVSGMTLTFWAFVGVESATIPAEDVENPERNIARATVIGTLIAGTVYILGAIAVMGSIPIASLQHSTAPFADCAKLILGDWGRYLIAAGAAIACFGTLNGWLMMQGQIPYAAARDGLFPAIFAKKNNAGAPIWGILISSILITILLFMSASESLVEQFKLIILVATLTSVMPYFITCMAQLIIFVNEPKRYPRREMFKRVFIALVAGIYSYCLIVGSGQEIVYLGTLLLFSGIPLYVWLKWRKLPVVENN